MLKHQTSWPAALAAVVALTLLSSAVQASSRLTIIDSYVPDSYVVTGNDEVEVVSGGDMYILTGFDTSTIHVSGGSVRSLYGYDTSTVRVSGGDVVSKLVSSNTSTVHVSGGEMGTLYGFDTSTIHISGGDIHQFEGSDNSTFNIFGTGLSFVDTGTDAGNYDIYRLTGTLQDGTLLDTQFRWNKVDSAGVTVNLFETAVVPTPVAASTGLALLGVMGLARSRRRRAD